MNSSAPASVNRPVDALLQRLAAGPATRSIERAIVSGKTDRALRCVELLVERIFCEPLNTAVIFSDPLLDAACQWLGKERLQATQHLRVAASLQSTGNTTRAGQNAAPPQHLVCVVSKLQRSGGHTAVLADILSTPNWRNVQVTVLLTGVGGTTKVDALKVRFSHLPKVRFESAPRFNRLKKLDWLQRRLHELRPADVMLVNHHQDSTAVAAVQPNQGYRLHYLHHGDHHLCLGVHLLYACHYDLHPTGFRNCRLHLGFEDNVYLPLTLADTPAAESAQLSQHNPDKRPIVSCTVGASNKIEMPYWLSYAELLPLVLAQTRGIHVHIGRLSLTYRLRILWGLKRRGIALSQFRYLAQVDDVRGSLHQEGVNVYLSSFPYGGAKTMVEVMAAEVPMAVHVHTTQPFLSAIDMAPPLSLLWQTPQQLLDWLSTENMDTFSSKGQEARRWYEENHLPRFLFEAMNGKPQSPAKFQDLLTKSALVPDALGLALETATQFTIAGLVRRKWKFYGRLFRSSLS